MINRPEYVYTPFVARHFRTQNGSREGSCFDCLARVSWAVILYCSFAHGVAYKKATGDPQFLLCERHFGSYTRL